jgi:hypothetical protein
MQSHASGDYQNYNKGSGMQIRNPHRCMTPGVYNHGSMAVHDKGGSCSAKVRGSDFQSISDWEGGRSGGMLPQENF